MSRTKQVENGVVGKRPSSSAARKTAGKTIATEQTKMPLRTKFKPGALALKEIRKYQKSSDLLIRKRPFQRLVKNIIKNITGGATEFRFQAAAFVIFQEAAEGFIVSMMEDAHRCAIHAKRVTLLARDLKLVYKIKYSNFLTHASC